MLSPMESWPSMTLWSWYELVWSAAISLLWSFTLRSALISTNFDDHSLEAVRNFLMNQTNLHFAKLHLGFTGTKVTESSLEKFCGTLQQIKADRCYLGASGIRMKKSAVSFLADLCRTINAEFFSLSCFMVVEWDRHDYEMLRSALQSNEHLKAHLLNYVSD